MNDMTPTSPTTKARRPRPQVMKLTDAAGQTVTISSAIIDGAQAGEVEKTDSGTLVLSGPNTYSGGTTIEGGMHEVGGDPPGSGQRRQLAGGHFAKIKPAFPQ